MFQSLKLGKCFGIDLYVHGTFWLLPLMILVRDLAGGDPLTMIVMDLLFIAGVFGCIVLHELGHALAARGYGIGTRDITLYPVGGIAMLERMPEKPAREVAIALAGPAVNLVIAGVLFGGLLAGSVVLPTSLVVAGDPLLRLVTQLLAANLLLCAFNLLPAFPMDGGRVLRALLAVRMTRFRATRIAVHVGTVVAAAFLVVGFLVEGYFMLVPLAVVVYLLGQAELAMTGAREAERAIRERFEGAFGSPADDPVPGGPPSPGFSGLAWDATRRMWVEWKNGVPVGAIPPMR